MTQLADFFLPLLEVGIAGGLLVAALGFAAGVAALDYYIERPLGERLE